MFQSFIVRPTFQEEGFAFEGPIPAHHEAKPLFATLSDSYTLVVGPPNGGPIEVIAIDIPDLKLVEQLLNARIRSRELDVRSRGITDDIYMHHPSLDRPHRLYQGWGYPEA